MFFKFILFIFLLNNFLYAKEIKLEWLKEQPRTYTRDFYIWQYLKQNKTSAQDALIALGLSKKVNKKILYAYAKKSQDKNVQEIIKCMRKPLKSLLRASSACIHIGMTFSKASILSKQERKKLILKQEKDYSSFAKTLKLLEFDTIKEIKKENFLFIFNNVSSSFRYQHLNLTYSQDFINKIYKKRGFERFIKKVVTNNKLKKVQKSLFFIDSKKFSSASNFYLAMNLITHNKIKESMLYLKQAGLKTKNKSLQDKILFWKFMVSKEKKYIKKLLKSPKINIYTLFAKDYYQKKVKNVFYSLEVKDKTSIYDVHNVFSWIKVLRDTKRMNEKKYVKYKKIFSQKKYLAHLAFVKARYEKYKYTYFINPYKNSIKNFPKQRQDLINAIARQESRFIPSSLSTAYAMGVMQIMPFLSKALAKGKKEPYDIYTMLEANKSIQYANTHLNYLSRLFKNPLLIAYAYNGGGGFTRSMFKKGLFTKKGIFEPYLSMEKVPYVETREYGKKVLSNYIMYASQNKKRVRLNELLGKVHLHAQESIKK